MTRDAARKAVFNTPELLENIISFLSPTDILTKVQRLSHQWKDAVNSSPTIKAKLWMRSQNSTAISTRFDDVYTFPGPSGGWHLGTLPMYLYAVALNPKCCHKTFQGVHFSYSTDSSPPHVLDDASSSWNCSAIQSSDHGRYEYFGTNFGTSRTRRDTYLTNPPIAMGTIEVSSEPEWNTVACSFRDHGGVTFGAFHDTTFAILAPSMASGSGKSFHGEFTFAFKEPPSTSTMTS